MTKVRLQLAEPSSSSHIAGSGDLQYKTHPHVDKAAWSNSRLLSLKDVNRPFPVNQSLGVLRWRLASKDESLVPLSITCWPAIDEGAGSGEVNVEYELEASDLKLQNVVIAIPIPEGSAADLNAEPSEGSWVVDEEQGLLLWTIDAIDSSTASSGRLEFNVSQGAVDNDVFFPVKVDFVSEKLLSETSVSSDLAMQQKPRISRLTYLPLLTIRLQASSQQKAVLLWIGRRSLSSQRRTTRWPDLLDERRRSGGQAVRSGELVIYLFHKIPMYMLKPHHSLEIDHTSLGRASDRGDLRGLSIPSSIHSLAVSSDETTARRQTLLNWS